jgi:Flp pilus assembly protein TadB
VGILFGAALLFFTVVALLFFTLLHLIFSLPVWLLVGGVVLYIWMRKNSRRNRVLEQGRGYDRYLGTHSRW